MRKVVLGNRTANPRYFDMANRFRKPGQGWYGQGFRVGDRCAAHVWLADYRLRNPDEKIVVVEDSWTPQTLVSKDLPGVWLFKDIADEVWVTEYPNEEIPHPPGGTLYHVSMWRIWLWLAANKVVTPSITPTDAAKDRAQAIRRHYGIPDKYITLQPLWDAGYDRYRNEGPTWWHRVVYHLSKKLPVVLLGTPANALKMPKVPGTFPVWEKPVDIMTSLALIEGAATHVGGETGTSLWAPVLQTPTVALYRHWGHQRGKSTPTDTRPMSFGKPVVFSKLGGDATQTIYTVASVYSGLISESTKW